MISINPTHLSSQMRFMRSFDASEVNGMNVKIKTSNPMHIGSNPQQAANNVEPAQSFANVLMSLFKNVNADQVNATNLQQMAITNPEKVNVHQVTTAMAKAEMSLGFLKSVNDRVINAFRELSSFR